MNVVAIIQARMGSTRLPGKVLFELGAQSVLAHVVERCKLIDCISQIVVATTTEPQDDPITIEAERLCIPFYRGSEQDVLSRYYTAAQLHQADVVVRITSDCPFLDPNIGVSTIQKFLSDRTLDYCSTGIGKSLPRGVDLEVFTFSALKTAHELASQPYEREHVTAFIYQHPEMFKTNQYNIDKDYSNIRLTLDTEEDWLFIKEVYRELHNKKDIFLVEDIVQLLMEKPHLGGINNHIEQKRLGTS